MPRKVFTAGEVLAAADVNSFLMDQTVMSFAGTAARGSAIGTAVEGMVTYLEDSNILSIYDGSAWKTSLAPTGSILQVVMGETTTTTSTTSTDGVDTALSVSITPKSAANKILVISISQQVNQNNVNGGTDLRIRRGASILNAISTIYFGTGPTGIGVSVSLSILDSPNTTSAITYGTSIRSGFNTNTATVQGQQNIIVMEVAG
jgi:hypothetical protein